ncbi:hypothetical protein RUM43_008592 [Polyplax serrata]|uniref:Phosphatidic acid phosphatase type 2/haloperoxidase domain-containing protein n=1 Tax=Polyplax serrata TaxID=468196 RepID=A0AAN8P614_POLSC
MALEDNVKYCNLPKNIESDPDYEWVPLSLTTVEYPKGKLQHMNNKTSLESIWRAILTTVCLLAASIVTYSRIYLQYHTWNQVLTGILVGFIFASIWFAATFLIFTPLYPTIASWRVSEFLLLRDTTLIPNVLWFEYTKSRQEARARARKLVPMKSQ